MTCVVEGGNPRPTIKWIVILSSNLDPVLLDEGAAELALNVTESRESDVTANRVFSQELTRSEARIASVQRIHHNSTVVCLVNQPTLKSPLNASILLDVQCKSPSALFFLIVCLLSFYTHLFCTFFAILFLTFILFAFY